MNGIITGITAQTERESVASKLRAEAEFNDAQSGPVLVDTAVLRRAAELLDGADTRYGYVQQQQPDGNWAVVCGLPSTGAVRLGASDGTWFYTSAWTHQAVRDDDQP
jgi:hypothetical protein